MAILLTPEKPLKVCAECNKLLAKFSYAILEVSQVTVLLVSSLPAVQYRQLHYPHLEIATILRFWPSDLTRGIIAVQCSYPECKMRPGLMGRKYF